jgi:hypothetical protein
MSGPLARFLRARDSLLLNVTSLEHARVAYESLEKKCAADRLKFRALANGMAHLLPLRWSMADPRPGDPYHIILLSHEGGALYALDTTRSTLANVADPQQPLSQEVLADLPRLLNLFVDATSS